MLKKIGAELTAACLIIASPSVPAYQVLAATTGRARLGEAPKSISIQHVNLFSHALPPSSENLLPDGLNLDEIATTSPLVSQENIATPLASNISQHIQSMDKPLSTNASTSSIAPRLLNTLIHWAGLGEKHKKSEVSYTRTIEDKSARIAEMMDGAYLASGDLGNHRIPANPSVEPLIFEQEQNAEDAPKLNLSMPAPTQTESSPNPPPDPNTSPPKKSEPRNAAIGSSIQRALTLMRADIPVRWVLRIFLRSFYRIKVFGRENIPLKKPALITPNHISFADPLLIDLTLKRPARMLMRRDLYGSKLHWLFALSRAIPVDRKDPPKKLLKSLREANDTLKNGEAVVTFPEWRISRLYGMIRPFLNGMEKIVKGVEGATIIPAHIDELWRTFDASALQRLKAWPQRVQVAYGKALPPDTPAWKARLAVKRLEAENFSRRVTGATSLALQVAHAAKRHWNRLALAEYAPAGQPRKNITFGKMLVGAFLMGRLLANQIPAEAQNVGVMLPPTIAAGVINEALALQGKVPVNLNYVSSLDTFEKTIENSEIAYIVTSSQFIEKLNKQRREILRLEPFEIIRIDDSVALLNIGNRSISLICAEEMKDELANSPIKNILWGILIKILPSIILDRTLFWRAIKNPNDTALLLYTSGSSGYPNGAEHAQKGISSIVESMRQILSFRENDRIMSAAPFFHVLGSVGGFWLPMISGIGAVYHTSPLEAQAIADAIEEYEATRMLAPPKTYEIIRARVRSPEKLKSLNLAISGVEQLPPELAKGFKEKFGQDIREGYGTTEFPVLSVNIPDFPDGERSHQGTYPGSVGMASPGAMTVIVDPDSVESGHFKLLAPGEEGMILATGPGLMKGYYRRQDQSGLKLKKYKPHDGEDAATRTIMEGLTWYVTEDMGVMGLSGEIEHRGRFYLNF